MSYGRGLSTQPARVLELVNAYVSGWSQMYNKATITSAILTAISSIIFAYTQDRLPMAHNERPAALFDALSTVSYLAVICNCYATLMALLNADKFSQTPLDIAQRVADEPDTYASSVGGHILSIIMCEVKVRFCSLFRNYWVCYFIAGYLCVCVEFVLYAWAFTEGTFLQVFASTLTGVALLPIALFWLR